jgi:uncharacterized membrane protein YfcA
MEYVVICLTALGGSALTFFSGFGLGTLLTPVFAIFFPIELAIALTAIVHFMNNLFKLAMVARKAQWKMVLRFGVPSAVAALGGALLLRQMEGGAPVTTWQAGQHTFEVTWIKLVIGLVMFFFALYELIPAWRDKQFDAKYLIPGGFLSGFFGGLSGHQGALRSAFLVRSGLGKEAYIGTGVVIACMVDVTRLSVYAERIGGHWAELDVPLLVCATLSAFLGAFIGNKLLKKITLTFLQYMVGILLMLFSVMVMSGLI